MDMGNIKGGCVADYLYGCRENFAIVALTGLSGSGCSSIARMMNEEYFYSNSVYDVRKPSDVPFDTPNECSNTAIYSEGKQNISHQSLKQLVFKREYTICYNFLAQHYKSFAIVKYNKVLWLLLLRYLVQDKEHEALATDGKSLKKQVAKRIENMYHPSYATYLNDKKEEYIELNYMNSYRTVYEKAIGLLNEFSEDNWDLLFSQIKEISENQPDTERSSKEKELYYNAFFGKSSALESFYTFFNDKFSKLDYYCFSFFYHRLGFALRAKKNPIVDFATEFESLLDANENLFVVVKEINWLIKCVRNHDKIMAQKEDGRTYEVRICIDSLRNSLEAAFLRERYSAFYLIAVNDDKRQDRLKHKIKVRVFGDQNLTCESQKFLNDMQEKAEELCLAEAGGKQFESGQFAGVNIAQCIMDAEIHFVQASNDTKTKPSDFYSVGEQWLKFASLIFHPGLIAPSSEERCMEVAYNAKFNSGCISRQVGAAITNKHHTIRSIGWNDVPYGQIPCSLREISDLIDTTRDSVANESYREYMYSTFELSKVPYAKYKEPYKAKSFIDGMRLDYGATIKQRKDALNGLPYPYCFKFQHNLMMKDTNQVFTKSLHAEENAMMQMVKYGGEGLMDGIIYVTASPCELCSKKLYQLGVRKIVYIDPYPGIAREHIISAGFRRPDLHLFKGAYGATYNKLYKPIMAYKDELTIRLKKFDKKNEKNNNAEKTT